MYVQYDNEYHTQRNCLSNYLEMSKINNDYFNLLGTVCGMFSVTECQSGSCGSKLIEWEAVKIAHNGPERTFCSGFL